jgi:hypothetical protein
LSGLLRCNLPVGRKVFLLKGRKKDLRFNPAAHRYLFFFRHYKSRVIKNITLFYCTIKVEKRFTAHERRDGSKYPAGVIEQSE